jgi:hypothetical protein
MNTPAQKPPRCDFAVRVERTAVAPIVTTMQRAVGAGRAGAQLERSDVPLFPERSTRARGTQTAKFVIRDNLRYRRDIERATCGDPHREAGNRHRQRLLLSRASHLRRALDHRGRARRRA